MLEIDALSETTVLERNSEENAHAHRILFSYVVQHNEVDPPSFPSLFLNTSAWCFIDHVFHHQNILYTLYL